MRQEVHGLSENYIDPVVVDGLVGFFDLLARFDYEDKKRSGMNPDSSASVPGESGFVPDKPQDD